MAGQVDDTRRNKLKAAWNVIGEYEHGLIDRLITGLTSIPGVRIYGITSRYDWDKRVATVSIRKQGLTPQQLHSVLAKENVFAWEGNFYAVSIAERIAVEQSGGLLRIGLVHYNVSQEVDKCLELIERA